MMQQPYNPSGAMTADRVTIPYKDAAFDCALLSSLFTHMTEEGTVRYLSELSRVLKSDGRALVSLLLMNEQTSAAIEREATLFQFTQALGAASWTLDPSRPLEAVSVSEEWFKSQVALHGFAVAGLEYGSWRDERSWKVEHDWVALQRSTAEAA